MAKFQVLVVLIFLEIYLIVFTKSQELVCEVYPTSDFYGVPLLSLKSLDIVYDINLTLNLQDNEQLSFKSIKLHKNCKLLTCSLQKLKGSCVEYDETNIGSVSLEKDHKSFQSAACKCKEDDSSRKARKIEPSLAGCGKLFDGWYNSGHGQEILFPGSVSKLEVENIQSVVVKEGCEILLWTKQKREENKQISLTFGNSFTFLNNNLENKETPEKYEWACCFCDPNSEAICNAAKNLSMTISNDREEKDAQDFSQFIKYGKKIIGIGRNYRWKNSELAKELKVPKQPIVFMKPTTSYIQEGQAIQLPESLGTIFYELELGVVIGKGGKAISVENAVKDHVAGYFLALDMTAKEFIKKSGNQSLPWEIGKGFDTACPVSHFIPKHLIPDPNNIDLECKINGNITQSDNTRNMIFDVATLISYISRYIKLEPYDTIVTGTPDGLGPIHGGDVIEGRLGNWTTIRFEVVNYED